MADMDVTARFRADISDMKSKMDQVTRSLDGMQKSTKNTQGGFSVLKNAMGTAFGGAIVGGIYAAGKALGSLASSSIDAASNLEETASKVNMIFGTESAAQIQSWAANAATSIGQSSQQAMDAAATFAVFGKAAGLTGTDLTGFSTDLTELASDLASFGNTTPEEAIQALGGALRGETEPIRKYGVMLDAASMQQKAFEMGLTKTTKDALLPSQKALVAQALIMEQTTDAQGDFARTSDGLANSQRSLAAVIEDTKAQVGTALLPAITAITQAIGPLAQQLAGPLGAVAEQIGTVLAQAFQSLTPILPVLAESLGAIISALGTGLMNVIQALVPALIPLATTLGTLATSIAPLLEKVLGKVAELFAKVLSVVVPLLDPLIELIMGILNAAWPIIELVADALMTLVDALAPVLDAVIVLLKPIGELIEVLLAAILPILKPILPVFKVFAEIVGVVLTKAVGLLMVALGGMITGFSKLAPFILRNVTTPIVKFFLDMAKKVVGAAASMLGWVPGLGDKLREAETAIGKFASDTEKSMRGAADAIEKEGGRIGSEMVNTGTAALAGAAPALGASARQLGGYTANQFVDGWAARLRQAKGIPSVPLAPPVPTPKPVPTPSGTSAGASAASKQEEERMAKIEKFVSGFEAALERMKTGKNALIAATAKPFSDILGDLAPSEIESAFGIDGSIGTVISSFDQLGSAIDDFYKPLMNAKRFGKKAAADAKALHADAKSFLDTATRTALQLMKNREANKTALATLETDYSTTVDSLNRTYDDLDKAAAANIKSIEDKWDALIPGLENALSAATAAFDKENNVLQSLIQARDNFLGRINDGFRGFLNNLTINKKQIVKEVENAIPVVEMRRTIKDMGNGIRVTIEEQIKPAMEELADSISEQPLSGSDIKSALDQRLAEIRAFATNIRTLTARGVDASLIQEFVSAGVQGAGEIASALAVASDAEIAGVNAAQSELATEIAGFQTFAAQQWFNAGIAQQEAIVAPLAAARDQAAAALATANATRTAELAAAQAHAEALKVQRQQALDAAKAQYETQKNALIKQGEDIDLALTTNATNLHNSIANLQNTVPPEMMKAGKKSVTQMLAGFNEKFPGMKSALNQKMDNLAASMNRTATVTVTTVQRTIFDNGAGPDGKRALGGPVLSGKTYLVGERGPELLTMGAYSGTVIPNDKIGTVPMMGSRGGGGNTTIVNINVQTGIATDPAETGRQVVEAIRKYERRSGAVFASA